MLMIGVTLALGGVVVAAAMGGIGQADASVAMGSSLQEAVSGMQLSLVYAAVASSGSCPTYQGVNEGTLLTVSLFDYGTASFTPSVFVVNSTIYPGNYSSMSPGMMNQYLIDLRSCAHGSGLTVVATDAGGGEVQVAS
jgi:hypothetical protein